MRLQSIVAGPDVFFELLAKLVNEEPADIFSPIERFQMKAIGIEHGKPFNPDAKTRALLSDAAGNFLDGAKNYKLHIPANVPAKDFWSVLVYDSLSRSELQNSQKFPSVSKYGDPKANADGSVDIYFGPTMPAGQEKNWINTVPGKGWFPIFRFYGPLQPLFDKSWKLPDIEQIQ